MTTKTPINPGELYAELTARGIKTASHYSDLYFPVTPETREIVSRLTDKGLLSIFENQVEGGLWYDAPFCFSPYWEAKQKRA